MQVVSEQLERDLYRIVAEQPGRTGRYYMFILRERHPGLRRRQVNQILYYSPHFVNRGDLKPAWDVCASREPSFAPSSGGCDWDAFTPEGGNDEPSSAPVRQRPDWRLTAPTGRPVDFPERDPHKIPLCSWQHEAVHAWYEHGCSGIVEAVTGSGKTRVALAAIGHQLREGRNVLVIVPSIVLQRQWFDELSRAFRGYEVHRLGDGAGVPRSGARLVVGVVNSCASHWDELRWIDTVVADECHNYGASTFRRALLPHADRRLGLTATLERLDDAVDEVLLPYFGGIVYRCDFRRAYNDGRIALARIALVGVRFDADSSAEYDEVCQTLASTRGSLIKRFGVPPSPFGEFMKRVAALASSHAGASTVAARRYLQARSRRTTLLAECPQKTELLTQLAPTIAGAGGALVFSERIEAAQTASELLSGKGVRAQAYHSKIPERDRDEMLNGLRGGRLDALCSARALDEGIDVPAVNLGVIAAGTQQRRQMVQRLGRILRSKADGSAGQFLIAFVHGTLEDPALGAHEGFLEFVRDIPGCIRVFPDGTDADSLRAFLDGDDTVGDPLPKIQRQESQVAEDPNWASAAAEPETTPSDRTPSLVNQGAPVTVSHVTPSSGKRSTRVRVDATPSGSEGPSEADLEETDMEHNEPANVASHLRFLEATVATLRRKLKESESANLDLRRKLDDLVSERSREEALRGIPQRMADLEAARDAAVLENERLLRTLDQAVDYRREALEQVEELKDQNQALRDKLAKTQVDTPQLVRLRRRLQEATDENLVTRLDVEDARRSRDEAATQMQAVQTELKKRNAEFSALAQKLRIDGETVERLQGENAELRRQLREKERTLHETAEKIGIMQEMIRAESPSTDPWASIPGQRIRIRRAGASQEARVRMREGALIELQRSLDARKQ